MPHILGDLVVVPAQHVLAEPVPEALQHHERERQQRVHGDAEAPDADLSAAKNKGRKPIEHGYTTRAYT
ncbi:hypothetical protein ON010_g19102 [Phytophthora cinnamomi]|nr:hypothetical protein ON010_g19102 [Phytophthora cinnamomi]